MSKKKQKKQVVAAGPVQEGMTEPELTALWLGAKKLQLDMDDPLYAPRHSAVQKLNFVLSNMAKARQPAQEPAAEKPARGTRATNQTTRKKK